MASDIRAWTYTADDGKLYQLGVAQYIGLQEQPAGTPLIGGVAQAAGTRLPTLPRGLKPRVVKCFNATSGKGRTVVCMTSAAPLFAGTVSSINLQDGTGTSAAYSVYAATGERSRARRPGV